MALQGTQAYRASPNKNTDDGGTQVNSQESSAADGVPAAGAVLGLAGAADGRKDMSKKILGVANGIQKAHERFHPQVGSTDPRRAKVNLSPAVVEPVTGGRSARRGWAALAETRRIDRETCYRDTVNRQRRLSHADSLPSVAVLMKYDDTAVQTLRWAATTNPKRQVNMEQQQRNPMKRTAPTITSKMPRRVPRSQSAKTERPIIRLFVACPTRCHAASVAATCCSQLYADFACSPTQQFLSHENVGDTHGIIRRDRLVFGTIWY